MGRAAVSLVAVLGLCGRAGGSTGGSVDDSSWRRARHSAYPVMVHVPPGWSVEEARDEIVEADVWALHPGGDLRRGVWIRVGWLPRGGRQSAFFPGGGDDDAHTAEIVVAGRAATAEMNEARMRVDLDAREIWLAITSVARDEEEALVARRILERLAVDDSVKPPSSAAEPRRAYDLARRFARERGIQDRPGSIVYTGLGPGPHVFRFTLFEERGLTPVTVDTATARVDPVPLPGAPADRAGFHDRN